MADSGTVPARWAAGFHAILPDGTELVPGETVVDVPKDEANDSDNWTVDNQAKTVDRDTQPDFVQHDADRGKFEGEK